MAYRCWVAAIVTRARMLVLRGAGAEGWRWERIAAGV